MTVLALGAITRGKMIFLIDCSNLEFAYVPSFLGSLINFVTLAGISLGIFSSSEPKRSFFLSTIFFLTPIISKSPILVSPLIEGTKNLDQGWLEPSFVFKSSVRSLGGSLSSLFLWPNFEMRAIRSLLIFISIFTLASTFNF